MFHTKNIISIIDGNNIDIENLRININKFTCKKRNTTKDNHNIKDQIKDSNLYIILEGEQIYTKVISIPRVKKSDIYNIVKIELSYYFINIDDILFSYKIIEEKCNMYNILIFYINSSQVNFIKEDESISIKKITPIQILATRYFMKKIKYRNYVVIFKYNNYCYFTIYEEDNIKASYVEKVKDNFNCINKLYNFFESYYKNTILVDNLFFINFPDEGLTKNIKEDVSCIPLGSLNRKELISMCR